MVFAVPAAAQDPDRPSFVIDIVKRMALDPTASHFRQWRSNEQRARQLGYQ
jgi:hypothetical protein